MEQALASLSDPGDPHARTSDPAGAGGGVVGAGRGRDLMASDGLAAGEEGALRVLALVPELFPIELKTAKKRPEVTHQPHHHHRRRRHNHHQ